MYDTWLNWMGDRNAQLFRELKGRATPRNLALTGALAIALQLLILGIFLSQLPWDGVSNTYCDSDPLAPLGTCVTNAQGDPIFLWTRWWHDICQTLNWFLLFLVTLLPPYFLASDIDREERQGTLNFLRLSPQSGTQLLLGKLLGVPVLFYWAIALLLPLHLWSAIQAQAPVLFVPSFYGLLLSIAGFLYSFALLSGFAAKLQPNLASLPVGSGLPLLLTVVAFALFVPIYCIWNINTAMSPFLALFVGPDMPSITSHVAWFYLPLGHFPALAYGFSVAQVALVIYGLWQALSRCFHSPGSRLLSKAQSYGVVVYLGIFALGFFCQPWPSESYRDQPQFFLEQMLIWSMLHAVIAGALIFILCNRRQTLLDWARYRHLAQTATARPRTLWQELLWGEKSPAMVAIALNISLFSGLGLLWVVFWPAGSGQINAVWGIVLQFNTLAIYGTIVQRFLLMKSTHRAQWATATILSLVLMPFIATVAVLDAHEFLAAFFLLFSPIPLIGVMLQDLMTLGTLLSVLMGQIALLGYLNWRLTGQLRQLGRSSTQATLSA